MRSIKRRVDQHDQFGRAVADDQVLGIDVQDGRQILLAHERVARRIGLDQVRKIVLQILEHLRRGIVRVGDETEIDDVFGLFVAHQVRQRRRMRRLVKEMPPQLGRRIRLDCISNHCAFHPECPF